MTVGELIKHLQAFDKEHPVIVVNSSIESILSIDEIRWDYSGFCKIIVDGE